MHDLEARSLFSFKPGSWSFDAIHLRSSTLQCEGHLELRGKLKYGVLSVRNSINDFRIDFKGKESDIDW